MVLAAEPSPCLHGSSTPQPRSAQPADPSRHYVFGIHVSHRFGTVALPVLVASAPPVLIAPAPPVLVVPAPTVLAPQAPPPPPPPVLVAPVPPGLITSAPPVLVPKAPSILASRHVGAARPRRTSASHSRWERRCWKFKCKHGGIISGYSYDGAL
ncbi:leucine-rich repeat extensin-like protein 3 [Phragmites australis]|uniref:leucine-rich repeat extensin-like protein 3 n=1 Tax=Phragmites australis TaxID=29695 RepID=UPI002D79B90A|nr:leucine-rich repeat extensin-like protein 3 [Phragmites australis]